jgi:hypothetical protein
MEPLYRDYAQYDLTKNRVIYEMYSQYGSYRNIIRNIGTVSEALLDLDNYQMTQLLSLCKDISELYSLPVFKRMPGDTTVYRDGNSVANMNSKEFVGFILGYEVSAKLKRTRFVAFNLNRGVSLPGGTIVLPSPGQPYQGGYNPGYRTSNTLTDIGRIGLEVHELWHQIQWQTHPLDSFLKLVIVERIQDLLAEKDPSRSPYLKGDSVNNAQVLKIRVLDDIETFEGQAQFIGQWAADVFRFYTEGHSSEHANRLLIEARIIINSEFKSMAAQEILSYYQNMG